MYIFSNKLKSFAFILMALGIVGIAIGFISAPSTTQEVEQILQARDHGHHVAETHEATAPINIAEAIVDHSADVHESHQAHLEHVLHGLQNRPWAAVYVACIFALLISAGALAFYAIQNAAQAGWSPVLFRVMEGVTGYLLPGTVLFLILMLASGLHLNHLFVWMADGVTDPASANYDAIIAGKSAYLNVPRWIITAVIILGGWNFYRYYARKHSLAQDKSNDITNYKKIFKASAAFLAFFIVTESIASWDWIMSIDPHWYSTLFGWYVLASFLVSAVTVIAMVTIYLRANGYLPDVNTSHIHDLAKFMFGLSIFWTYLWFSQFMLQWYSNIPEEVVYFISRIENYNLPFFGMLVLNFVLPLLILVNTDFKRLTWIVVMVGIFILCGHYLDFFNMIMPGTVGAEWYIGAPELGAIAFFAGLLIYCTFSTIAKQPLVAEKNPLIEESKHFHY